MTDEGLGAVVVFLIIIFWFSCTKEGEGLYWHSEVDDRYVMSFRFWNLLFQLASRMEPGISRFINQFLEHEMLLSADRKKKRELLSFEKIPRNWPERATRSKKWKQTIKNFILCNEIRFSRKKVKIRRRKENIALTSNINPIYFISNWLNSKLATVFHKKGVSCDVVVIKYCGSSIPVLKDEDTMNKKINWIFICFEMHLKFFNVVNFSTNFSSSFIYSFWGEMECDKEWEREILVSCTHKPDSQFSLSLFLMMTTITNVNDAYLRSCTII